MNEKKVDLESIGYNYNELDDVKGFIENLKYMKKLKRVEIKGMGIEDDQKE